MFSIYEQLIQGLLDKGFESVDNWFFDEELIGLRKNLLRHYEDENFRLAGIGNNDNHQTVKKIRNDKIHWLNQSNADDCEKVFFSKIDDFVAYLNRTCFAGIRSYELHYAVYEKGSFYKKHVDQFQNDDRRQFSIVFYLSESWNPGDGGELILYLSDNTTVTIEPTPGKMIFFKSDIPHEVLVTHKQRLSLTGWMKTN